MNKCQGKVEPWGPINKCDYLVRKLRTNSVDGNESLSREVLRQTPSQSCLVFNDFPTGVILLPLEE